MQGMRERERERETVAKRRERIGFFSGRQAPICRQAGALDDAADGAARAAVAEDFASR